MCTYFLKLENCAKSYFKDYPNYSKDKHTEILEVIILQNLTKINIVFFFKFRLLIKVIFHYYQIFSSWLKFCIFILTPTLAGGPFETERRKIDYARNCKAEMHIFSSLSSSRFRQRVS